MKRLISFALTLCMVFSLFAVPTSGLASSRKFLVAEGYNEIATGKVPESTTDISETALVREFSEGKSKAVELAAYGDAYINYSIESESRVLSVYADLKFEGNYSATSFYAINASGAKFNLATIDETGKLFAGDGRLSARFPKGIASSLQITYDMDLKKATIYMGGKCVESNRYMGSKAYTEVAGFGIETLASEKSGLYLDNFAIFEGSDKIKSSDIPKKGYNPEVYAVINPGELEEYVGDTIFYTRTFDEENRPEFDGLSYTKNGLTTVEQDSIKGDKHIKLKKESAENTIMFTGGSGARYVVMSADISTSSNTPSGGLIYGYLGGAYNLFVKVGATGGVSTTLNDALATIAPNKWVNIAIAVDKKTQKFNIYIDGELKKEKVVFSNKSVNDITMFVIGGKGAGASGDLLVDNILVYEGKEPREIDASVRKSLLPSDNIAVSYLGTNRVFNPFSGIMHINRVKSVVKHEVIREKNDAVIYAHSDDLKTFFGENVSFGTPHATEADYYNVEETGINSKYLLQKIDTRLMIFNTIPVNIAEEKHAEILRYMSTTRPKAAELTALFNEKSAGQHPRILINQNDLDRILSLYKTDPYMKKWGDSVIARAEEMLTEPEYKYIVTAEHTSPDVMKARIDLPSISMAYLITKDQRYLDRAWSFIDNACNLETWNRRSQLQQGEMGYVIAIAYDWLFDYWTDAQKKRIEDKLYEEGLKYTEKIYYGDYTGIPDGAEKGWWGATNNWNFVCNATGIGMAVALYDLYPDVSISLIENAVHSMEYASQSFYPHGAWSEGASYWDYAATFLISAILTCRSTFGTDFGLSKFPAFDKSGWYGVNVAMSTGIHPMGDSGTNFVTSPASLFVATEYDDAALLSAKFDEMERLNKDSTEISGTFLTMIYYNHELASEGPKMPLDTYMEGSEVVVLREDWYNSGAASVAVSGGNNTRNHGHMDIGTFTIDMGGERFANCTGTEAYNLSGMFSGKRYYYYRNRTEGHNLYVINNDNTLEHFGAVRSAFAPNEILVSKARGAIGKVDLSEAYAPWTNSAVRGYMLSDDRRSVTIRDEISLKQPDSDIHWGFHTKAKVESINGNSAVLSKNGKKVLVTVSTNAPGLAFKEVEPSTINEACAAEVKSGDNKTAGYRKLALVGKASGDLVISVKFKQYDDDMISPAPVDLPISQWTIPDGEVTPLPDVKAIYIDGTLVENFSPDVTGYSKLVSIKETVIPTVTAEADTRVEVTQAPDFGGDAIIRVYAADNNNVYKTYRVNIYKLPPLKDVNGLPRYNVAEVTASAIPEPQNGPTNVVDGDRSTRWAANGQSGHWITLELDDTYPINKVGVSWHSGDSRKYKYAIEVSADGVNWTQIYSGESSGTTNNAEYIDGNGVMARFVRYVAYGNNQNEWNSITEIEVLGGTGNGTITAPAEVKKEGPWKIATVGDSLTQGFIGESGTWSKDESYPMIMAGLLGDGYEVKNFGLSSHGIYSGHKYPYTTKPEYTASLEYNPDAVIIMMGTNDAKTEYWDTIKGSYRDIYKQFVQSYLNLPSKPKVILGIPTPVFGDGNFAKDRPAEIMNEMRSIIQSVASELGLKTVNFYDMMKTRESDFPDGLHFNRNGATTVATEFKNAVTEALK